MSKNPLVFIIFGATGDLATRKILPALLEIWKHEKDNLLVVAFSRRPWTDDEYRSFLKPILTEKKIPSTTIAEFLERVIYVSGTFDDTLAYYRLHERITDHEKMLATAKNGQRAGTLNILCHFAIEPEFYKVVARGLSGADRTKNMFGRRVKIMLEKPFGSDYRSATEIRNELERYFPEKNIYHVDHYLAKKGLRKVVATRRLNKKFESSLNGKHLGSVSLYLLEKIGIEGRAKFYDAVGAIRDVGQNHMMEMLLAAAMELPPEKRLSGKILSPSPKAITVLRKNRRAVLRALKLVPSSFWQGQCQEYVQEEDIAADSKTETAFAFDVMIDLPRWRGVRFEFRSGKYLYERKGIEFHFKSSGPDKTKGDSKKLGAKRLFPMEKTETGHADAYKTLIEKAFIEDQSYFVGIDDIMAEWKIIDEVRKHKKGTKLTLYKKGAFATKAFKV